MSDDASSQLSPDRAGLVRLFEYNLERLRRMDELASEPGQVAIRREDVLNCLAAALIHDDFAACEHWIARLYSDDVPFMIIVNELANFRDNLIKLAANASDLATVHDAVIFFDAFKDRLASLYLVHFLHNLEGRNHVRLRHISSLSEKNLLIHFESHLQWMKQLVDAVSARNHATMPETHHELCEFGTWLHQHGRTLIRDESHYQLIDRIHAAMHDVVKDIEEVLDKDSDRHLPLLALMKKTERHSLDLGNEISMLNNMVIMSVYNKDALTGALTRRNLERILINELELSRATETPFCLLMGDLDHFKAINDNYGHVVGDRAIAHFAGVVRASLRQVDLLFRYGGEEFLMVLPSTHYEQGKILAERVRANLNGQPLQMDDVSITLHASFGLMEVHGTSMAFIDSERVRDIIRECDQRLYTAKQRGRDQVA